MKKTTNPKIEIDDIVEQPEEKKEIQPEQSEHSEIIQNTEIPKENHAHLANEVINELSHIDGSKALKDDGLIKNKKTIVVAVLSVLSILLIAGVSVLATNIIKKQKSPDVAQNIFEKDIPNMEKYTVEYFKRAQEENRILNNEEKEAYIKLFIDRNSLLGNYASNKTFTCSMIDPKNTLKLEVFSKGASLRMDISKIDNGEIQRSAIMSTNDFWGWSPKGPGAQNIHAKINDLFERLQVLDYTLGSEGQSADVFAKSCKEANDIEDSKFTKPSDTPFTDL